MRYNMLIQPVVVYTDIIYKIKKKYAFIETNNDVIHSNKNLHNLHLYENNGVLYFI